METEKAGHETEGSLILAQLNADSLLGAKIQNGSPASPEGGPTLQVNGEGSWGHRKAGINVAKRHRENCGGGGGGLDQGPYAVNGELKHGLGGDRHRQPKKLRPDGETNGEEEDADMGSWDKKDVVACGGEALLADNAFPELTEAGEFKPKPDKRNCSSFSNGDIFSLPRNNGRQMPMANGATPPPTSMEGTPGDLLERTLSQYYPEQVSIARQCGGSQPDDGGSLARCSPSLPSGYPLSEPAPDSQGSNGYNAGAAPYLMNGYSNSYGGVERQGQQQQQERQQPSYPLQGLQEQGRPLGQRGSHAMSGATQSTGAGSPRQNGGTDRYPAELDPQQQGVFGQNHGQGAAFPGEQSDPLLAEEGGGGGGGFGSYPGPGQRGEDPGCSSHQTQPPPLQRGFQYRGQAPQQQQQHHHQSGGGNPCGSDALSPSLARAPHGGGDPGPQQQQALHSGLPNGTDNPCSASPQMGWIDLNSSHGGGGGGGGGGPQTQQQMWRGFPGQTQAQPGQHGVQTDPQARGPEPDPTGRFQMRGEGFVNGPPLHDSGGFQQQQQDGRTAMSQSNPTPEWPQQGSSAVPHAQVPRPGQLPPPQGCNASDGRFGGPEQHLCEDDPDLEEILSSSFLPPPQQQQQQQQQQQHQLKPRPLSHPSLYETPQQMKSPVYRPQSQPQPGQQVQPRAGSAFPDLPSPQPANNNNNGRSSAPLLQPDAGAFGYGGVDAAPPGLRESCGFNRVDAQRHYAPSPGVGGVGAGVPSPPRQHLQPYPSPSQQQHHPDPNCDQLQHRRCNPQSDYLQSTQSHGAQNQNQQQATAAAQMYIKTERHPDVSESCGQFQRVRPPAPGHPGLPGGDYHQQRHAALRMHLLQRQERLVGPPPPHHLHSPSGDFRQHGGPMMRPVKIENGPRFEPPGPQQQQMQALGGGGGGGGGGVQIKQEPNTQHPQSACEQRSILATMEQTLRQYQLSPVFERNSLAVRSPSRIKVESSGAVTILSTNTEGGGGGGGAEEMMMGAPSASAAGGMKRHLDFTPKKEALLQNFVESPLKLLDTPIRNLLDTPIKNQYDIPSCHCMEQISEKDEGPYYTHLGAAPNVPAIRETMESRSGLTGAALRIEKVVYTGKEGKSTQGCPIAKWVIRRSGEEEKLLVLVRERSGHRCQTACVVVAILIWEGIPLPMADRLYLELSETLTRHGAHTQRRCAINEERTCACQGLDPEACGASFSFGCSWSMYYNGCKFARSKIPRKFKLLGDDPKEEERLEHNLQSLATIMGPTYKQLAPDAYANQVEHEHRAPDCRLGHKEGRPFSGVTACVDFCAHAHRDLHNMQSGSTVVCTLTSQDNRQIGKIPEDEQLHVLPLYKAATTDEFGSEEGQRRKVESGAIQVFSTFRRQIRMLSEPAKSCRQKKLDAKKAAANKNSLLDTPNAKAEKAAAALQAKMKSSTYESSTAQSAAGTGPNAGPVGQPPHPPLGAAHQQLQQHQNQSALLPSYPGGPPHPAGYPRFPPGHPGNHPFPSTSKPGGMYASQQPQQPPAGPYPHSPLHLPGSPYMNGSNPALGPYAGSLNRAGPYAAGYPCNGGMPLDGYHPYYAAANSKHLDAYRQQQQQQQPPYGSPHQRYGMGFTSPPPRYGEQPGLQVNGYGGVHHPASPYSPYGPNATAPDPSQFLDGLSRPPSAHHHPHPHHHHPGLDYAAAVSKGNQLGGYPGQYLTQGPQMYPPGQDPFRMQIKTEMGLAPGLGGGDCLTPGFGGLPNGGFQSPTIKQEPGTPQTPTPAPATPQKPELWSDNEHNFLDPDIGGVAVAPTHGSILIECAKRELHATTPLKNPDRNHPKRISLVFYQHKNMNEAKHGLALWEAKMAEKAREKEEEAERNGGEAGTPSGGKSGGRKGAKREHVESASAGAEQTAEPPSKRFIQALLARSQSCVTNTYVTTTPFAFTKVTGPYSKFV